MFRKYGTILSVHTMINKTTGLSKGYGFVSYAARDEAQAAISAMDGFRVSGMMVLICCLFFDLRMSEYYLAFHSLLH